MLTERRPPVPFVYFFRLQLQWEYLTKFNHDLYIVCSMSAQLLVGDSAMIVRISGSGFLWS